MPNITPRQPARPPARPAIAPKTKTKILLIRQPVKNVRHSDQADPTALRLAIGVITAIGIVAVVWLMGYLGFRLGFAPLVRVPDLLPEPGAGLATGTMMLIAVPRVILQAGIAQPGWLMLGFALIAIPAASLGALKPATPGGPRQPRIVVVFSYVGAIVSALCSAALIFWTASPFRRSMLTELPFDPMGAEHWLTSLEVVSGLDVLAVIIAALWVVVVLRLSVPLWLRSLAASLAFFCLVVVTVAMAVSNAAAAQVTVPRSVTFMDDGSLHTRLLLGDTRRHMAMLITDRRVVHVELIPPDHVAARNLTADDPDIAADAPHSSGVQVIATQSIVDYLREQAARIRRERGER